MQTIFLASILLLLFALFLAFKKKVVTKGNGTTHLFLKTSLDRVISRHRLLISEIDFLKNELIALDSRNNKVVSIIERKNVVSERVFSLSEVRSCRVITETDQLTGYIRRVVLELMLRGGETIGFNFFDEVRDGIEELPSQVKKAKYWKRKIQLHLNSLKQEIQYEYVL
jgi:hypothetical protein